ncbi:MAG: ABC transporter ATP-binding protein [Burkholderiaceae bacterium]|nr:ABC transporter ATP-binding protein [Burkholderiaceae bacterium]
MALLQVDGLTRRFGGLTAVSDLSFSVAENEILGLIGPNGAGKSTTFNVISGFCKPSAGRIVFDGHDISGHRPDKISRRGLVRTFQHASLLREMSVHDNLLVATISLLRSDEEREQRVRDTAAILGLGPHLGEPAGNLPHGLQRLVSIAIAFARRPKLLCLDEPLTGLNQIEVTSTLDVFRRFRAEFGITTLLVEHNMKAVMEICDRIVVLNHGIFLAAGTPEEVSCNEDVVSAYLGRRK